MVKKYMVFTYYADRPMGGANDYLGDFDTMDEALDNILVERRRYYQVVERRTMRVVKEGLSLFKRFEPGEIKTNRRRPSVT